MKSDRVATVVVGHGSLLADSGVAMMAVADILRQQASTSIVEAGFLNLSQPTFADAVQNALTAGVGQISHIVVQPYFLIAGHYVAHELPTVARSVAARHAAVDFLVADVFGAHPAMTQLACRRLVTINPKPNRDTALLFVAHGTPIPTANKPIAQVLAQVQQQAGYGTAAVGYLDCNEPNIPEAFAQLAATGVMRIDVLPYFLHLGRHVRKDLPALFQAAHQSHPAIDIHIAEHLGYDSLLAVAAADRIADQLRMAGLISARAKVQRCE